MGRLRSERYEYIKEAVVNTLIECNITTVPINPFEICRKKGYLLIKYTSKYTKEEIEKLCEVYPNGFSYYSENGDRIIEYNDTLSNNRIRTTLFHEIGHTVLKHTCTCELAETEAEWFAAYIIAPPPLVNLYNIESSEELSIIFDASLECAYNCMSRYLKWKRITWFLRNYEKDLVNQFSIDFEKIYDNDEVMQN